MLKRKRGTKKQFKTIYIITEGTSTEPNYFESKKAEVSEFRKKNRIGNNVEIKTDGTGFHTRSIVDYAIDQLKRYSIDLQVDDVWVVFDKDDFTDFDQAIEQAKKNNLKVAYSNECFELWYWLHFELVTSALKRTQIKDKLNKHFQNMGLKEYEKNLEDVYLLIKSYENKAINNAKYLIDTFHKPELCYSKQNPSTTVHLLVIEINKLMKVK